MKKNKITREVMKRVMKYEESKTNKGLEFWGGGVLIMLGILIYAVLELIREMADTGTFDLLAIITSDWEIARELSGDIWEIIRDDFPWNAFWVVLISLFIMLLAVWYFGKKLSRAKKLWKETRKYFDNLG